MPNRRREPLLGQLVDVEMGYVGDEEAIPAVTAAAPWQSGQSACPALLSHHQYSLYMVSTPWPGMYVYTRNQLPPQV